MDVESSLDDAFYRFENQIFQNSFLTQESEKVHPECNDSQLNATSDDEDPLKGLLPLNDSIFNDLKELETDNQDENNECSKTSQNKSKLFLNETLQDSSSEGDDTGDCINNDFSDQNVILSNEHIGGLKTKLFESFEEVIPPKKIKIDNNKSEPDDRILYENEDQNNQYYGLPKTVEVLIKKYKGIDKLYGR